MNLAEFGCEWSSRRIRETDCGSSITEILRMGFLLAQGQASAGNCTLGLQTGGDEGISQDQIFTRPRNRGWRISLFTWTASRTNLRHGRIPAQCGHRKGQAETAPYRCDTDIRGRQYEETPGGGFDLSHLILGYDY